MLPVASTSCPPAVAITVDGVPAQAPAGGTILDALDALGLETPTLCHKSLPGLGMEPVGACRACIVELEGSRVLVPSCARRAEAGMVVRTATERVRKARRIVLEMLLADHPTPCAKEVERAGGCELERHARALGVEGSRLAPSRPHVEPDLSSPAIAVDLDACIQCWRCVRACDEVQVNGVIGVAGRGFDAHIVFDHGVPMGASTCVTCGECVQACPTGALTDKPIAGAYPGRDRVETVDSVCPYCGVGCSIRYHVDRGDNRLVRVTGRADGRANLGRLCVKGRYGFDYQSHPDRLTTPLVRRSDFYPKEAYLEVVPEEDVKRMRRRERPDPAHYLAAFRPASWDEALDVTARRLLEIKRAHGPAALAGFGSAKCSNEDNYLFQKLVRSVFGTNNVDHCTRLCHASSVAALNETLGSAATSNAFAEALLAETILVIGSNTTENHPVAATFVKQAAKRGACLIVADPRRPDLADHARHYLRFKPGTDVALLNGILHVLIAEGLVDRAFIRDRTEGFDATEAAVRPYTPEVVERIAGVPRDVVVEVARAYGRAKRAIIFWGMGISQHTTGTDNARALIALALATGNVGRPGTGLHPLRGQNNVQGASDVGLIPMFYPGYQSVESAAVREAFERAWGVAPLDPVRGLTVVEIMAAAADHRIRGMYMMGENPFLSDPNINKVKKALAALEFLCVQDIFLTETAEFADVILPATAFPEKDGTYTNTDRRVQLARKAVDPPGEAREDWAVVQEVARHMGADAGWRYRSPEEIFREIAVVMPIYAGLTWEMLGLSGELWPLGPDGRHGVEVLFERDFPRGKGRFVAVEWAPPRELPDADYPYVLNTGRLLEHWHTGTMTRRSFTLDARAPEPFVEMHPDDLGREGLADGEVVRVRSRRGHVDLRARAGDRTSRGSVFIPFHFKEAAANVLTIDALDPFGKIPEFKYCAVRVEKMVACAPARAGGDGGDGGHGAR